MLKKNYSFDTDDGSKIDLANLEFQPDTMLAMGQTTLTQVIQHLKSVDTQSVGGNAPFTSFDKGGLASLTPHPAALEDLLDYLFQECMPRSLTTISPGYMAFIPGGGVFPAALADLIADTTNRFTGLWQTAPALVQLEATVLDWFREWMQFPPLARGLFTTGGSTANFNAILCAREHHLGTEIRRGVLYTSTQVHHSVIKSAKLAGIMPDRVRQLPVDKHFRLRCDALETAIQLDRKQGLNPFLVVSAAGTTNTGAVDRLNDIADICATEGLWHHIDGAYGAFFHLCESLRPLLSGLPRADSLTLDPHKGLFLPYGTGALLVRDGEILRRTHSASAGYLPPDTEENYSPSQYGPDLSRGFPGLRVWLCIKLFGMAKLQAAITEKRTLALEAAQRIAEIPGIVMVAPPQLSLFAFYLSWPKASLEQENQATQLLLEKIKLRGKILLTGCWIENRFLARVCILSFRSRREHVDRCVEHLAQESAKVLAEQGY